MADTHVVTALKAKREAIRKAIIEYEEKLKEARFEFITITDALKVFGEKPGSYRASKYQNRLFRRGCLQRALFNGLREAQDGLDTVQLVDIAIKENGLDASDRRVREQVRRIVGKTLPRFARENKVVPGELRNGVRMWRLA
jgi:hypothetical protein